MNSKSKKTVAQTVEKQLEHVASVEYSIDRKFDEKEQLNGSTDKINKEQ